MPNFKKDTSKFQMKNMAYWKAKFNESESNSAFGKLYSAGEEQSKEQKERLKRDMRDADAGMIK